MAMIKSRGTTIDLNLLEMQDLVREISMGMIDHGADIEPGDTVEDCIEQVQHIAQSYQLALVSSRRDIAELTIDNVDLHDSIITMERQLSELMVVAYDEAMDHAAMDLMDAFCASGSADVSADGELVFDQRISFTKEDIKPILKAAIDRWVECRLS